MSFWDSVKLFFARISRKFVAIMKEIYDITAKIVFVEFIDLATNVCMALTEVNWKDADKRENAVQLVWDEIKESGRDVSETVVRTLVATAYERVKKVREGISEEEGS